MNRFYKIQLTSKSVYCKEMVNYIYCRHIEHNYFVIASNIKRHGTTGSPKEHFMSVKKMTQFLKLPSINTAYFVYAVSVLVSEMCSTSPV